MVAAKRGSRPRAGQLMTDLTWCMLWSTSAVAGEYEHRRTTRLIHFRHRIFRLPRYRQALFKKDMSRKGGNRHPVKILPWDHIHESFSRGTRNAQGFIPYTYAYRFLLLSQSPSPTHKRLLRRGANGGQISVFLCAHSKRRPPQPESHL